MQTIMLLYKFKCLESQLVLVQQRFFIAGLHFVTGAIGIFICCTFVILSDVRSHTDFLA